MKRDKMKEDNHLNKMIEDWKKKRSCVGVCYLVKVKMMKDKKFRREAETWNQASNENESEEEETLDYEEEDTKEKVLQSVHQQKALFSLSFFGILTLRKLRKKH